MRVLLIDQFGEMGGAQFGLLEAAAGFAAKGWQLHALAPEGPLLAKLRKISETAEPIVCGPFRAVRKTFVDGSLFATQLYRQVRTIQRTIYLNRIDVLYVNGPRVLPAAALGRCRRPLVFHAHSVVQQESAARLAGIALRVSQARVIVSSRFVAGWLEQQLPPDRIQLVYNGVAGYNVAAQERNRYARIGVLGRVAPEKRQLLFIDAAKLAQRENTELRFIVGGGPVIADVAYWNHVKAAGRGHVTFLDWVDDVADFFQRIDLLVVPSERVDANPRVIIEAFAAGVPVLAFDSGGIPELIENGINGLLIGQHDAKSLAEAILKATGDPQLLNQMASAAHALWQKHFTLTRFQSDVSDAIGAAASADPRAPAAMVRPSASA